VIYQTIYRPILGNLLADISNIGLFYFAANDMANDFPILYRQQAKKEISDISAVSADKTGVDTS